jgi:hypothetical protein
MMATQELRQTRGLKWSAVAAIYQTRDNPALFQYWLVVPS